MARIYYVDGTIDDDLNVKTAPRYGVLAVLHDGIIEHGFDWYVREAGQWVGVKGDASMMLKILYRLDQIDMVLAGESVPNEIFQPVLAQAVRDQGR